MNRILIVSQDSEWTDRLASMRIGDLAIRQLNTIPREISPDFGLILVDLGLLPTPDSLELAQLRRSFAGRPVVVVYRHGQEIAVSDVRRSFISGAKDLVQRPLTPSDVQHLLGIRGKER